MTENADAQEEDGVDVADGLPERHLGSVRQLLLQLRLLLLRHLDCLLLLQAAESHHGLLA